MPIFVNPLQLSTNGFDETYPLEIKLVMIIKEKVFLELSMSNCDVDLAHSKTVLAIFLYFCHNLD